MNFSPSYAESPPKRALPVEQAERKAHSDNTKAPRPKKSEKKDVMINLDWSGNGLTTLDSLNLFPDLLTLNLSENQLRQITPDFKSWYCSLCQLSAA